MRRLGFSLRGACACVISTLVACSCPGPARAQEQTWVEVEGVCYGAQPDERGPIGGGPGYREMVVAGDFEATDLETLIDCLARAKPGQVVFIPGETEIDLTTFIYIEQFELQIPQGVTLAGNRGYQGSAGAILTSDALQTRVMIRALGPNVRVTGLRIRGPNSKRYLDHHRRAYGPNGKGPEYYYKFPVSDGIHSEFDGLIVDNCEISGFSLGGINLARGKGHHIHHCYIHHCQYQGLGYGVVLDEASALIECNLFDWNRHSIAGTGRPGCSYVARNNVELGVSLSHCFDMHGGRDRRDGTDIAGTRIEVYKNTFRAPETPVVIRGVPQGGCEVHHNWFLRHATPEAAVRASDGTHVFDNAYGDPPRVIK